MPVPPNRNYAFSQAFLDELVRSGLGHACICPGSRSTPLVVGLAEDRRIKTWTHLDERSASYFALGISRTLNEPVACISTSGTAAANFFPAIIEAHYSHVPLLIITADRPPELWECGANQTIDQVRMFGNHAKWSVNIASPEVTQDLLRYVRELACRVYATATQTPAGPVHINFPFGEPLVPKSIPSDIPESFRSSQESWEGRGQGYSYTNVSSGRRSANQETLDRLVETLSTVKDGVIVCGPQLDPSLPSGVAKLAKQLEYPILADPLSQTRCGPHDRTLVIDTYDAFLRSKVASQELQAKVILRLGATPTSKVLQNYIGRQVTARQILIREGDWQDPMHAATDVIQADPTQFVETLTTAVKESSDRRWSERWQILAAAARETIRNKVGEINEMFEGRIFQELGGLLPSGSTLFAGNSMPVRDLDAFFPTMPTQIRFLANRGVSGIDGVVSTALGVSCVTPQPTTLVVGDLSFYHDMNGLLAAKRYRPNATIIVLNNDGGGIFSFLPQHDYPETFEKYFATPHGLTFQSAASLYGLGYSTVTTWEGFRSNITTQNSQGSNIVEVQTNRERNLELHHQIWSAVEARTQDILTGRT